MIKKIAAVAVCLILIISLTAMTADTTTTSEDYIPSDEPVIITSYLPKNRSVDSEVKEVIVEVPIEMETMIIEYKDTDNIEEIELAIIECESLKLEAHSMAEAARNLGYKDTHPVILLAKEEWAKAHECLLLYQAKYRELIEAKKYEEYPVATEIWNYLKDLGYNNYICAGIMGNIMAEVGGQTLEIQYWLSSYDFCGICQWYIPYCEGIEGQDLTGQLDYLRDTIKYEFDTFGFCYQSGFDYNDFLNMTNEREAAIAFAMAYERCSSLSYWNREENATVAYNYFVD